MASASESRIRPLAGIRVLEIGGYLAAPFAGLQLADLGADVLKVEAPADGDPVRLSGPFIESESSAFIRLNRNKRSLALDLKPKVGKDIFKRLVKTADVVIENLRPGTMLRLGLDARTVLRELNPKLIYLAISGWGQDGPLSDLPGMDIMAQARSGLMSITGEHGGPPIKIGVPICDLTSGLYAALSAVAALRTRDLLGVGQMIDISLFESGVSLAIWEAARYFATGEIPFAHGSAHQNNAPYQAVRCSDGYVTIGATTKRNWHLLCVALNLVELESDPRFVDNPHRHQHREALIAAIESVTGAEPIAHWLRVLNQAGIPCAPIQNYQQVFTDELVVDRKFLWDGEHTILGEITQLGSPMRFSLTETVRAHAGPVLGEHTRTVLEELGYTTDRIRELETSGVVRNGFPAVSGRAKQ